TTDFRIAAVTILNAGNLIRSLLACKHAESAVGSGLGVHFDNLWLLALALDLGTSVTVFKVNIYSTKTRGGAVNSRERERRCSEQVKDNLSLVSLVNTFDDVMTAADFDRWNFVDDFGERKVDLAVGCRVFE